MSRKTLLLVIAILVAAAGVGVGLYFLGKINNRTESKNKVSAISDIRDYSLQFHMTNPFADFLYARGVWRTNALRINKQNPPQTVEKAVVTLQDRDLYKGTKGTDLPVVVSSKIAKSKDGKLNIYYIDVFLDTSQIKRYPEKDLERIVFLAILSQIYEDTARTTTTYEGRVSKREYSTNIADSLGAIPLTIKELE